ncbi:MAG TPA: hypothetical protein VMV94_03430 [Phycisphaerae bacterium]|nr:hypothetical protein [Phycisphaerae bacterium]
MTQKRRRRRLAVITAYLITGAIVLQLGPVCSVAATTSLSALPWSMLVDANGRLFGIFQVCNVSNTTTGTTTGSTTAALTGDLIFGCP